MEVALKDFSKLAPLAVALAIVGIALAWLLQHQTTLGTWLLAAFLVGHGLVHIMFVAPVPASSGNPATDYPFGIGRAWLVTSGLIGASTLKAIAVVLVGMVIVGYSLTALATVGLLVPATWWSSLMIASTIASLALMVIGFAPMLALGIAIDIVLLLVAIAAVWAPTSAVAA